MMQLPLDPDVIGTRQGPAMMITSEHCHDEVVLVLLEAGADIHLANNTGVTALMSASEQGHVEVVSLLLQAGADKNMADIDGDTALKFASFGRSCRSGELVVGNRCRPNFSRQQRLYSFACRICASVAAPG